MKAFPKDAEGNITGESQTQSDHEFELIVWTMQRFPQSHPEYRRIRDIRDWAMSGGALREGFPKGTEAKEEAWNALVSECRRMVQ